MAERRGFFDLDGLYGTLSKAVETLERLCRVVNFEIFGGGLDPAQDGLNAGWLVMDAALMCKVLIILPLYGFLDARAGFQTLDRRSFGRLPGLDYRDQFPNETTTGDAARLCAGLGGGHALRSVRRASNGCGVSRHGWKDRGRYYRPGPASEDDQ
ncbi:MAG: hypothetical protein AAGJ28_21920 [Pseudomonadota bacterium]